MALSKVTEGWGQPVALGYAPHYYINGNACQVCTRRKAAREADLAKLAALGGTLDGLL